MMKQTILVISALVVLGLIAPLAYSSVTPAPSTFILQPDVNFETVAEGSRLDHTFSVENRGDATLRILRVKSG